MTFQMTDWIDVSVTVKHGMPHWPDNPPIVLERMMDLGRGDACNVSRLAMGVHSGTHMDGPVHFLHEAAGLDEMPLTATMVRDEDLTAIRDSVGACQAPRMRSRTGGTSGPHDREIYPEPLRTVEIATPGLHVARIREVSHPRARDPAYRPSRPTVARQAHRRVLLGRARFRPLVVNVNA